MYYIVDVYDNTNADIYMLEAYDERIIDFLKKVNVYMNGLGVFVFDGKLTYFAGLGNVLFLKVHDIIDCYSILDDDCDDEDIQLAYQEICNYIKNFYLKNF